MTITPEHLRALRCAQPEVWAPLISAAIDANKIRQVPDFLANMLHESYRLTKLRESMDYSPARLLEVFPTHFSQATANLYGRVKGPSGLVRAADEYHIAEIAYGGRFGNRPAGSGDGYTFRGAGPGQITFRANVEAFGAAIGWTDRIENLPAFIATPGGGAASFGQYWRAKGCDDMQTTAQMRKAVQGGTLGLQEVTILRAEVDGVLNPRPVARPAPARPVLTTRTTRAPVVSESDALNLAQLNKDR